jgi:hypothetical protein
MKTNSNVVLVHGAWADGSSWIKRHASLVSHPQEVTDLIPLAETRLGSNPNSIAVSNE